MYTTTLPITLTLAGGLALLNVWLAFRVGQVRGSERVSIGDGGNERVTRRMRAHANFAENAPLLLILVGLIEFAAGTSVWLWVAAGLFLLARALHAFGMDGWMPGRMFGTGATMGLQLLLAVWAVSIPLSGAYSPEIRDVDPVAVQG